MCAVDAETGARRLVSGSGSDAACTSSPSALEGAEPDAYYAQTLNGAYVARTEGASLNASGTVLAQALSL